MSLKRRNRPIRNLVLRDNYIGKHNIFSYVGFANRGLITEKLTLQGLCLRSENSKAKDSNMLKKLLFDNKSSHPQLSHDFQELALFKAIVAPPLLKLEIEMRNNLGAKTGIDGKTEYILPTILKSFSGTEIVITGLASD